MALSLTARRSLVARQIRTSLAEAEAERAQLNQGDNPDRSAQLDALINALVARLNNRRAVVLGARQASLLRGIYRRRTRFRTSPVWGFPNDYDPNEMQDRCDICRSINWQARPVPGQDFTAWSCRTCPTLPSSIPQP